MPAKRGPWQKIVFPFFLFVAFYFPFSIYPSVHCKSLFFVSCFWKMDYLLWSSALLIPCLLPSYSLLCTTATSPVLLGWKATGRKQTGEPEQCISARPCSGHLSKKSSRQRPFLRSCTSSLPYVWGRVCLVFLRFQCDGLFSLRPPLSPPQTLLLSSNRTSRSLKNFSNSQYRSHTSEDTWRLLYPRRPST